jgi:multidrug resistance efflux pump
VKKRLKILVPALIVLLIAVSSPSIIKSILGNEKDENVYYGTVEADQISVSAEIPGKIKDIKVEEGKRINKGDLVAVISTDENNIKIQQAEVSVKSAENELEKVEDRGSKTIKNTAQLGVEQAKLGYDLAKIAASKGNLVAEKSGVVDTINFKVGEYVTPGSPIATLVDLNNLWVKIYVPERLLPIVKIDKEITLKSDFLKDKAIKGKVVYISSEAEFTPVNIVTKEDREKLVFAVKIKILDNIDVIKPGMLLDVNID